MSIEFAKVATNTYHQTRCEALVFLNASDHLYRFDLQDNQREHGGHIQL